MNKEKYLGDLGKVKVAAVKVHAAAIVAGKWDSRPEFEACLMTIISDMCRAVEANSADRHCDMEVVERRVGTADLLEETSYRHESFVEVYRNYALESVEDCLADAVMDILDTVEGMSPYWTEEERLRLSLVNILLATDRIVQRRGFAVWSYDLLSSLLFCHTYESLLAMAFAIGDYAEKNGMDLRRIVQLKMRYNETCLREESI